MLKKQLPILFILLWSQHSSCFLSEIFTIAKSAWKVIQFVQEIQAVNDQIHSLASLLENTNENTEILQKLEGINPKITDLKSYTRDKFNHLEGLINTLPDEIELRTRKEQIKQYILKVDDKWKLLFQYIKEGYGANLFKAWATEVMNSVRENLSTFRNNIAPTLSISPSDVGFIMLIAKHGRETIDTRCDQGETYNHIIARLFPIVVLTETKAYMLQSFAYGILLSEDGINNATMDTLRTDFKNQFSRYVDEFTKAFEVAALPYLRACDPHPWQRDVNFYEFDKLHQMTFYWRHNRCPYTAKYTCDEIARKVPPPGGQHDPKCELVKINDYMACDEIGPENCTSMHSPVRDTTVCSWDDGPYRVRFVQRNTWGIVGTDVVNACPSRNTHVDQAVQWVHAVVFCACQCTSNKWWLSTKWIESRVDENYVIVGMRFRKHSNLIYIQIAEGKLEANNYIANFSWKTPNLDSLHAGSRRPLLDNPSFFLDDLQLSPGFVLTGIRLVLLSHDDSERFGIQLVGATFDNELGPSATDTTPSSLKRPNRELQYKARSSITMDPYENHLPDSKGYSHILIRQSDLDSDYGQATLPFIDSAPIMTSPLSPIGGVGLFHKGYKDHAGFLSLRLFPMDFKNLTISFMNDHDLDSLSVWNN